MRSFLLAVVCLFLASTAVAQTHSDGACLELGALADQPLGVLWANSFSEFLVANEGELSGSQAKLIHQASQFGLSMSLDGNDALSIQAMKGFVVDARKALSADQLSEILARMGPKAQEFLVAISVINPGDIACSCTIGGNDCPEGFPCTVGCVTWGTGRWNGVCKRAADVVQ